MAEDGGRPGPTIAGLNPDNAPRAGACAMVIFGAAGDLTKRLLVPSLYNLSKAGLLPENFALIAFDHNERQVDEYRDFLTEALHEHTTDEQVEDSAWAPIRDRIGYVTSEFDDPEGFRRLEDELARVEREYGTLGNVMFYMAVPARFFSPLAHQLHDTGLLDQQDGQRWRRLVVEKPFGRDYDSAKALDLDLLSIMGEDQIYRIDHYLGKETVQNIMALRFANGFFEPLWNRDHINHVQITVAETVGVETRGGFYEQTGALRDMVPNHLFQLFSLIAMEVPTSFHADAVRSEKVKVLDAVHPYQDAQTVLNNTVRGQYGPGTVDGKPIPGYRQSENVDPKSNTETYACFKLMIDNWRWANVPWYLRTGKALSKRKTEIAIQFNQAPFALFRNTPVERLPRNWLTLRIQPNEGLDLDFSAKVPGPEVHLAPVQMVFRYKDHFVAPRTTGYETLLYDCMIGDATLFQRADNVEAGWRIVQPVIDVWSGLKPHDFPNYAAGSEGPAASHELMSRENRMWRHIF